MNESFEGDHDVYEGERAAILSTIEIPSVRMLTVEPTDVEGFRCYLCDLYWCCFQEVLLLHLIATSEHVFGNGECSSAGASFQP